MGVGDNLSVTGLIKLALQGKGASDAAKQLGEAKKAADQTKTSFKALEGGSKELGSALQRYISIAAVATATWKSITTSASIERSIKAMRIQMEGLGIDSKAAAPIVLDMLAGLRREGAGLLSETIPAFRTFLGLTKDWGAALALTKLASNMAEADTAGGGMAESASALASVLSGKTNRSLKSFGINVSEAADETVNAAEALVALHKAFPNSMADIEDMQNLINKFQGAGENLGANAGGLITKLLGGDPTSIGENSGEQIGKALAGGFDRAVEIAGQGDAARQAPKDAEALQKAKEQAQKIADADFDIRQKLLENVAALEQEGSARQVGIRVQALMEARDRAVAIYKAEGKDHVGIAMIYDAQIAKVEQDGVDTRKSIRQKELDDVKENYQQMLDSGRAFSQEATAYFGAETESLRGLYQEQLNQDTLSLARRKELSQAILDMEEQEALAAVASEEAKEAIRQTFALRRVAMEKKISLVQIQLGLQTAGALAGIATGIFGQTKSLQIAQTIINSIAAAVAAFNNAQQEGAPVYVAAILAAAALAYGFAQVRAIKATEKPEEAFDVPAHDEMVYKMGRKSIRDFVRLAGDGMTSEMDAIGHAARAAVAGASGGAQRVININGPIYGGDAGERELRRRIARADRFDLARRIR